MKSDEENMDREKSSENEMCFGLEKYLKME